MDNWKGDNASSGEKRVALQCFQDSTQQFLGEGESCPRQCPTSSTAVNSYLCVNGQVLGEAACVPNDGEITAKDATIVAGSYEAVITADESNKGLWANKAGTALSQALGAQVSNLRILDLPQSAGGTGAWTNYSFQEIISNYTGAVSRRLAGKDETNSRRLQQTTGKFLFEYEVAVLTSSQVTSDTIAARAYNLGDSGSYEYDTYKAALSTGNYAMTTGPTTVTIAPFVYSTKLAVNQYGQLVNAVNLPEVTRDPIYVAAETTEEVNVGAIIGGVLGGLFGLLCCGGGFYCYCLMRKRLRES
jgi:hypothetical protein